MHFKSNPLFWLFIFAQLLISGIFIIPLFMFYKDVPRESLYTLGGVTLLAGGIIYLWKNIRSGRALGRNLAVQGTSFWGLGWALMVLYEPQSGWWIFIGGWLALTIGLFINGTADYHLRQSIGWAFLPLMAGIIPPLLELSIPHYFTTNFTPLIQLQIMFLYASGWVLQGVILTHNELPQLNFVVRESVVSQ